MLPAHQDFGPRHAAIVKHLGLVVQQELAIDECSTQIVFQSGPFFHRRLQCGIIEAGCIAAGRLRLVHGQIGLLHQTIDG